MVHVIKKLIKKEHGNVSWRCLGSSDSNKSVNQLNEPSKQTNLIFTWAEIKSMFRNSYRNTVHVNISLI